MHTRTRNFLSVLAFIAAVGLLAGCGGKDGSSESGDGHDDDHDHAARHGGVIVESSDHKAHFELVHHPDEKKLTVYVLDGEMGYRGIGDAPVLNLVGESGSVKVTAVMGADKGETAAAEWHFTHDLLAGEPGGRLRVKVGSQTYMPDLVYGDGDHGHAHDSDHDHDHAVGPHDGMVAKFSCPSGETGYVELKLHDDKGDLELWIASDEGITKPFDLPIDSTITVTFTEPKAVSVTLSARNKDKNEDEDGSANNRDGKTNYFIFPGDSGQDPKWLMGTEFEGHVTVGFSKGDTKFESKPFELIPHTHGAGDHDHD